MVGYIRFGPVKYSAVKTSKAQSLEYCIEIVPIPTALNCLTTLLSTNSFATLTIHISTLKCPCVAHTREGKIYFW